MQILRDWFGGKIRFLLLLVVLLWLESVMANCHRNDLGVYVLPVGDVDKL